MKDIEIEAERVHTQILRKFILKTGVKKEEAVMMLNKVNFILKMEDSYFYK